MQCFRDAEIVAGPGGAAFTNLCFAQPGVKVLDLRYSGYPDGDWASWWRLCDILGLRYYNLITETDRPGLDPTLADLKITPKEVELMLDTMLSD
jgi:capsular polysaccharide biosynthesis protein